MLTRINDWLCSHGFHSWVVDIPQLCVYVRYGIVHYSTAQHCKRCNLHRQIERSF
jgi:hypothetical protein